MDASSLQTLASDWLCHSTMEGQTGCQSDKDYVWCRLLDRSQACCQQTEPAHSAFTATTAKEKCQKDWMSPSWHKTARGKPSWMISAADRMQWNSVQMIKKRTENRDTVHSSTIDSLGQYLVNSKTGLTRMTKISRDTFKRNTKKQCIP